MLKRQFFCCLTMLLTGAVSAGTVTPVDTDFSSLPGNFNLADFSTDAATAVLSLDDVAGSMGLVFRGSWMLAPGGAEDALGVYRPQLLDTAELIFEPAANDGMVSIGYSLDARLSGLMGDNVTRLFAQLVIYQQLANGAVRSYTQFRNVVVLTPGPLQGYTVSGLVSSDFSDGNAGQPEFGPAARPMAFGLQLGGQLATPSNAPGNYVGGVDADNWQVTIDTGVTIFADGFE